MHKSSKKVSEYSGHQPLKCGGCIAISHLHYSALKGAEYCRECCLSGILWSYVCLLISLCHIQLGSEINSCYIMTYCVLIWERCHVFPCILILLLQIKYGSQCTIFIWYTQHRCHLFCSCWYPPPCSGVLLDFSSKFRAKCFWTLRQSMLALICQSKVFCLILHKMEVTSMEVDLINHCISQ